MIILDTETTSLRGVSALPLEQQPRIIDIAALKVDAKLKVTAKVSMLINPGIPVPPECTKITNITDDMVKKAPKFIKAYPELIELFIGERTMIVHNLPFDRGVFADELRRIDRVLQFPWPPDQICTAEQTAHLNGGKYFKQEALYEHLFGMPANQTHRAEGDAQQLLEIVRRLRKDKIL